MDILPDIKLGPVTDREDAHRFAFGFARIVQPPQFGTLALRVPAVIGRTEGKDTLLGAALLFIAPRAAEGSVKAVFVERLLPALGLPHVRVQRAMIERMDALFNRFGLVVDEQLDRK